MVAGSRLAEEIDGRKFGKSRPTSIPNPSLDDQPFSSKESFALRPRPVSLASFDRVAAYSAATIGYAGGRSHFARYRSGVIW